MASRLLPCALIALSLSVSAKEAASQSGLATIEGVTLGQSRNEALSDGFVVETYQGIEYLTKKKSSFPAISKIISLRTAQEDQALRSPRVVSIMVSQLFRYDEAGKAACDENAKTMEATALAAVGRSARYKVAIVIGSALPTHLGTIYAKAFTAGNVQVESNCVGHQYPSGPAYNQDFTASTF